MNLADIADQYGDRFLKKYEHSLLPGHSKKDTRTLSGEDFLWLVLKHVLPKRFRRSRDYGFLHSNAKKRLFLVQLLLNVIISPIKAIIRPVFKCKACGESMKHITFRVMKPT